MRIPFLSKFKIHYLLALGGFAVWMLYFDEKDYFTQQKRTHELRKLQEKSEYYRLQIAETKKEIEDLDNDPAMVEKFAREKYFMKRDNEEVFIIETPAPAVPQNSNQE